MHTIKPLDRELIIESAMRTKKILTVEEASIYGGLGLAVCEVVSDVHPVPVKIIGVEDKFGKSGNPGQLLKEYGLTPEKIVSKVKSF